MKRIIAVSMLSSVFIPVFANAASQGENALEKQIQALNHQIDQIQSSGKSTHAMNWGWVQKGPLVLTGTFSAGKAPTKELIALNYLKKQNRQKASVHLFGEIKTHDTYSRFVSAGADNSTQTKFAFDAVKLAALSNLNTWVSTYAFTQLGTAGFKQAYVLVGNLNKSPVYFLAGKKEVDFGNFSRAGLVIKPLTTTTFKPSETDQALFGLDTGAWQAQFTMFNSGPESTFSKSSSRIITPNNTKDIGNFAADVSYGFNAASFKTRVGAGYLNGSGFANESGDRNPVYDLYATAARGQLSLLAEYDRLSHKNGSTVTLYNQQAATSSIVLADASRKVQAWNVSAAYKLPHLIWVPSKATASISQLNFDSAEYVNQMVLSYNVYLDPGLTVGAEYGYQRIENNGAQYLDNSIGVVFKAQF